MFPKPKTHYFSQNDYFLKSAKVFGKDISIVKQYLEKNGNEAMNHDHERNFLEFHINEIALLKEIPDLEIGITYCIFEKRENDCVLRELQVDLTTPKQFDILDL
jgi:uncharacterized protein